MQVYEGMRLHLCFRTQSKTVRRTPCRVKEIRDGQAYIIGNSFSYWVDLSPKNEAAPKFWLEAVL